ncbi:hypothetical protein TRVL_00937 [Trypanosoma vivax]|nr:hypothetical protein TRVL_00937 [Trypanosoma vivax]
MLPCAQEVEAVVLNTLTRGDWARALVLLTGAVRLRCTPTARTYASVIATVAKQSTWVHTTLVLDKLQNSPLSARALYASAVNALLIKTDSKSAEKLLAIAVAAKRRNVQLSQLHHAQCSYMLAKYGVWDGALMLAAQDNLVDWFPVLVPPLMLAAETARQWLAGLKIMSIALSLGKAPSADVVGRFVRCFTTTSPWRQAIAMVHPLPCSNDTPVISAVHDLLAAAKNADEANVLEAENRGRSGAVHLTGSQVPLSDLTIERAETALAALGKSHWREALNLISAFPVLLTTTPRPCALHDPFTRCREGALEQRHWKLVWNALQSSISRACEDTVLRVVSYFATYLSCHGEVNLDCEAEEEVRTAGFNVGAFLRARRFPTGTLSQSTALRSYVSAACACGWWEDALLFTGRFSAVFMELVKRSRWEAALVVYKRMPRSAQERVAPELEHLFISKSLWLPALLYVQERLPEDVLPLRSLAIPLCAALGQWERVLTMLRRYVSLPTDAEKLLYRACIVWEAETSVRDAYRAGDWMKGLWAWAATVAHINRAESAYYLSHDARSMSPTAVGKVAALLLDAERYDDCCALAATILPKMSDPILLHGVRLFYHIRSSPLSYGLTLQQFRESHKAHRYVMDCFAILALSVSGNFLGAFSVLQEIISLQQESLGADGASAACLSYIPRLKKFLPAILTHIAVPAKCYELEVAMRFVVSCMKSVEDIYLLNEPLSALWSSTDEVSRGCAFRAAATVLRHALSEDLPAPWAVMCIVSEGLESPMGQSASCLLYKCAHYYRVGKWNSVSSCSGSHGYKTPEAIHVDINTLFVRCAQGFCYYGQWSNALSALQHCREVDKKTLFQIALLAREAQERSEAVGHQFVTKIALGSRGLLGRGVTIPTKGTNVVTEESMEDTLLALMNAKEWHAALSVFFSRVTPPQYSRALAGTCTSSAAVGYLLSCMGLAGPWQLAVHLLKEMSSELSYQCASIETGLRDVLRSVRQQSGSVMCSRVVLFLVEEAGYIPTSLLYDELLHSCLRPRLAAVERDLCVANLKRLSSSLNERQVVDTISAISVLKRDEDARYGRHGVSGRLRCQNSYLSSGTPSCLWSSGRPHLDPAEFKQLCQLAPIIVVCCAQDTEKISSQYFGERFAPFELLLLLKQYHVEVMVQIDNDDAGAHVNMQLVEYGVTSKLLHILLVPFVSISEYSLCNATIQQEGLVDEVRWKLFHGFASRHTISALWNACGTSVMQLVRQRWPWLSEYELLREVRRGKGLPPASLITRPKSKRSEIAMYWSTYGRVLWPELFFSWSELCQLAVYVPLVEPVLACEDELHEIAVGIRVAHFSADSIPEEEQLLRRPHSEDAICSVFRLAFKTLKRLHAELDMDGRGRCHYFYHQPDAVLWKNIQERRQPCVSRRERSPRWFLALHILRHYRRCTKKAVHIRALSALFAACEADATVNWATSSFREESHNCWHQGVSWWELAIRCACSIEPLFNVQMWHQAMKMATLSQPQRQRRPSSSSTPKVEDIVNTSLRATCRVLLGYVNCTNADCVASIPFNVSLLLVDQMKELLQPSFPRFDSLYHNSCDATLFYKSNDGDDVLTVWSLLLMHNCFGKMNPLHVSLLQRLVLSE